MTNLANLIAYTVLSLISCFFLVFGIGVLVAAYHLDNPFFFIMTFFSSNLIILISGVFIIGFICRIIKVLKDDKEVKNQ